MITIDWLRKELKLGPKAEAKLEELRQQVIDEFERGTGRLFERRASYVETLQPETDTIRTLFLELWPIESIASVQTKANGASAWTTLETSAYEKRGDNQLYNLRGYWSCGQVKVTYTGGYTQEPQAGQARTPGDIARALAVQAKFGHAMASSDKILVRSQNFEGGSGVFHDPTWHPTFAKCVENWKRHA